MRQVEREERRSVSSESHIIRYPERGAAPPLGESTPQEGDEITRNGDTWIVEEVTEGDDGETVVKIRPATPEVPPTDDE